MILLQKTQQDTLTLASNIWQKYSISKDTLDAANLSYLASQTAFEGTKIEQEVGERTVLDILNARQSLLNAEIKLFNEQKNQEVIKAQVMYLAGILYGSPFEAGLRSSNLPFHPSSIVPIGILMEAPLSDTP